MDFKLNQGLKVVMVDKYWDAYSNKLFNFLNNRIGNKEIARDLLQDTFHKALLNKEYLSEEVNNPEAWLMSVARNTLIDYTRKKKEVHMDDFRMITSDEFTAENSRAIEGIAECLYELIEEYDKDERELLLSVFTKSMTQKEMAQYLDIPYSTLKSRIQKARNQILEDFRSRCCTLQRNSKGEIIGCRPVEKTALAEC